MEKQVKVNVSWNKRGVNLTTDWGMTYYFGLTSPMPEKNCCDTIVSSLVASLIVPTVQAVFRGTFSKEFTFEFKVIDKKKS